MSLQRHRHPVPSRDDPAADHQRHLDACNRKDVAALVACVDDAIVFENVSNSSQSLKIEGRDAFAKLAAQAAALFESRNQSVRTAVVDGKLIRITGLSQPASKGHRQPHPVNGVRPRLLRP